MQVLDVQPLERFEWAGRIPDSLGGDMGIARRRAQLGVTEQNLDHADVRASLQQMRGKAVSQGMQRRWL